MDNLARYKLTILFSIACLFFVLVLTTLLISHRETDEIIYQTLGVKLSRLQSYSLQGTDILKYLPQKFYDTEMFLRPPAFMVYLAGLFLLLGNVGLFLAPVLVYITLCFVIYKMTMLLTDTEHIALKALVLAAVSPQLLFAAIKIHVDLFLALMMTTALYFLLQYKNTQQVRQLLFAGFSLMVGVMTKYTALVLYPFLLAYIYLVSKKNRIVSCMLFLLPGGMLLVWFYYVFFIVQMSPDALAPTPDQDALTRFPFIKYVSERPFYFYFLNVFLVNPAYLLLFFLLKKNVWSRMRERYGFMLYAIIFYIFLILCSLTYFGIRGISYQMRYILPAEPLLITLLAMVPFERYESLRYVFYFVVIHNLLLLLYNFGKAEIFSFVELALR